MELGKFSPEQLINVKHVMFGKQKQANVTNEAVVKLIASDLQSLYGNKALSSESEVKEAIRQYVQDTVDGKLNHNDTVILLIVGEESYNCIKSAGPKVVSVDEPNPDSPKVLFRVYALGAVPEAEVPTYVKTGAGPQLVPDDPNPESSSDISVHNYKTRVEKLVEEISPMIPDAVKIELPDIYQQCLCVAEYYYQL